MRAGSITLPVYTLVQDQWQWTEIWFGMTHVFVYLDFWSSGGSWPGFGWDNHRQRSDSAPPGGQRRAGLPPGVPHPTWSWCQHQVHNTIWLPPQIYLHESYVCWYLTLCRVFMCMYVFVCSNVVVFTFVILKALFLRNQLVWSVGTYYLPTYSFSHQIWCFR